MSNWYVEYAIGNVSNRNKVVPIERFSKEVVLENLGKEIYRSMYLYDDSIKSYLEETQTVVGFAGKQSVDKIVMDIDFHKSPDGDEINGVKTIENVKKVIDTMSKLGIEDNHYQIWFSGTGFHIHLANVYGFKPQQSKKLADQVRSTMQRDFGNSIDLIYDNRRLIRAGYSFNIKSNLFKIPLDKSDFTFLRYDEIQTMARNIPDTKLKKINHESVDGLEPVDMSRANVEEVREIFQGNTKARTTKYITCAQHMYRAGYVEKKRHIHLIALVAIWYSKLGFDKDACNHLAKSYMAKMDNPLPENEVNKIVTDTIRREYNHGCNHPTLVPYCDSKCTLYQYKNLNETQNLLNSESMVKNLLNYHLEDYKGRSFDLQSIFPFMKPKEHIFKTGWLITLIGDTALGKTAIIQYILTRITHLKCLFLSLEVDEHTMSRRFIQASLGVTKKDVEHALETQDTKLLEKATDSMNHISMQTSSPDVDNLRDFVAESGCKLLVVDVLARIPSKYSKDEFQKAENAIAALKDIAQELDIMIIAIHHISKFAAVALREGKDLDLHSGKGTSTIEQLSDVLLGFQLPNPNRETDPSGKLREFFAIKARDMEKFHITLNFDWSTFTFSKRT